MKTNLKSTFATLTSLCALWGLVGSAHADDSISDQEVLEIPVETVLAPSVGYEEKNNIQIVVHGSLPNSCYTVGQTRVARLDNNEILVKQYAVRDLQSICAADSKLPMHLQMTVPFTLEVPIGNLRAGDYTFRYNRIGALEGNRVLTVSKNTTTKVDSLPYAATSNASVDEVLPSSKNMAVTLRGILNSTCTELEDEVKVMDEGDVLVLLPTVKIKPGVVCAQSLTPFEKTIDLGQRAAGTYLIHVRSMNGKALNRVVDVFTKNLAR